MSDPGPEADLPPSGTSEGAPAPAASEPSGRGGAASSGQPDPLRASRTSGLWTAAVVLVVLLVLLAVFVLQNTQKVQVSYFGWQVETPLAAALLIATAVGGLIVVAAGSLRILQLRRRVRRARPKSA